MNSSSKKTAASAVEAAHTRGEARRGVFATVFSLTLAVLPLTLICGCQSLSMANLNDDDEYNRLSNTDNILGPMARAIQTTLTGDVNESAVASPELTKKLDEANRLYAAGKYGPAASVYRSIANKQKQTAFGEEAQFKLGECLFKQGRYAQAQDAYDQLLEDYPATRNVDAVTQRLFNVARSWLDVPVPAATQSEIQQAGYEEGGDGSEPQKLNSNDITVQVPLLPNFHDRSRPIFDTRGRAIQALKSIWLNDPTGPLADDALMMTATHFMKRKNFVEADRYYKILREEYPKSPHTEKAFVLGSHVKLMSYQGPEYEGETLQQAKELKEGTLRLFPENPQRQQLRQELQDIYEAEAQRLWVLVEYWQRKNKPRAVALACKQLINEYPESGWAQKARKILAGIDKKLISDLPGL
ncbi:MAG: outer membrane protein assembly factor BamD [Planctomycetaceae bacterium]